ncbi:hypothetical protein [Xylanibacter ruminicola]|nr:hypothetical protein [Xylanibacter ruminicola]
MGSIEKIKMIRLHRAVFNRFDGGQAYGCWPTLLVCCLLTLLLLGCRSKEYVVVTRHTTDTLYQAKIERDSVWLHDSVYVKEKQAGDTIFITTTYWRDRWHERLKIDTLRVATTDSIPQPYPVTEYVEKKLHWWQTSLMWIGAATLFIMILATVYSIYRKPWIRINS